MEADAGGTEEAHGFAALVRPESGAILELGAGTGRLTIPLLELGWEVTALELSTAMLTTLRTRLADAPADLRDRCTLVHADMTAFKLGERFGTAILSPSTIDLLDDADRPGLYSSVREHLRPGGRFLLGMANPDASGRQEPLERTQEFTGRSGRRYVLHAKVYPSEEIRDVTIHPADESADPFVICVNRFRVITPDQIARELEQAGFDVVARTPLPGVRNHELVLEAQWGSVEDAH
uniref:Methyltransferase domain-containing protein n=1 Tax=Nonomuraea gerenzanensis TaxID=93944 RepID=A0A1M4E1F4_9ACTN|nr:hypothetical protein BN4615_P2188 [Nonomuraea gerenzanensis]